MAGMPSELERHSPLPDSLSKYRLVRAARPFSLVVSLVACGLGVALAVRDGAALGLAAWLVLAGGLLLQLSVNLINDYSDLALLPASGSPALCAARGRIRRNYRLGLLCFVLALAAGGYLVSQVGWPLLLLIALGALGAFGYTTEPINYKRRGLGVVLVFWLMGGLMVGGAYLAVAGEWAVSALLMALPFSALVALLLLANELRDIDDDRRDGIATLTVRLGERRARWVFIGLLLSAYLGSLLLMLAGFLPGFFWLLSLVLVPALWRTARAPVAGRRSLPPLAGRLLALFGAGFILSLYTGL